MRTRAILFALLVSCGTASRANDLAFNPDAAPAALAASFLKTDGLRALASAKRVAITQFRVEFAVENSASAQSSSMGGWTASRTNVKLVGVAPDAMREVADQLHARLVRELAAAGVEVISAQQLRDNEAYKSLAPAQKTSLEPVVTGAGKSVFVGAGGQPWYFSNDDRHLSAGTLLGNLSTTQPQNIEPAIASALDVAALRVTLAVAFVDQSTSGGMFRRGSSVTTDARLALVPGLTQLLAVTRDGRARVVLDQPVPLAADAIELVDTTSDKTAQAVANVITGLFARGGRSSSQLEARTSASAYGATVSRHGQALVAAMVAAMRPATPVQAPAASPPPAAASAAASSPGG